MGINYCLIAIYKKGEFVENESNPCYGFFLIYTLLCLNIQSKPIKLEHTRCSSKKSCKLKLFDLFEWFFSFNLL